MFIPGPRLWFREKGLQNSQRVCARLPLNQAIATAVAFLAYFFCPLQTSMYVHGSGGGMRLAQVGVQAKIIVAFFQVILCCVVLSYLTLSVNAVKQLKLPCMLGIQNLCCVILQTIYFEELMSELNKHQSLNLVEVAVDILRERISCLQSLMAAGRVSVEVTGSIKGGLAYKGVCLLG